ncbi:hypothetical protein L873DRAFT_1787206 [Choiromyces venosus 120613-1]|uniref:Uncharacterized protein n=1 Tax=Choiromyces venosus 120613-1 TaxID=1336337 RepID=A0A3N4JXF9_9PEZI|nr:hypothetical protein L873DRAFT_1787206 [Choiromyces venosus 120613-1]
MIANRTDLESRVFGELQPWLGELEEEIDHAISNAKTGEDNQSIKSIPVDMPLTLKLLIALPKQHAEVQRLLISLNSLSAYMFAAISVVERNDKVNSQRRQNPFHRNPAPIPIFQENPEQIWSNTLDTIKEVDQERKSFIQKIKDLIENMDIRRKILSVFLKSNQAKSAPSEKTAEETRKVMERTEQTARETKTLMERTELTAQEARSAVKQTKEAIEEAQEMLVQQARPYLVSLSSPPHFFLSVFALRYFTPHL